MVFLLRNQIAYEEKKFFFFAVYYMQQKNLLCLYLMMRVCVLASIAFEKLSFCLRI